MEKLKLPKKERPKGLYLYCNGCRRHYSNDSLVKCQCNKLVYKAKIHVSGTKQRIKSEILYANNFTDAFILFKNFKEKLTSNSFQKINFSFIYSV